MQAKNDSTRNQVNFHQRRSRKRSWTQTKPDYYQKESPKSDIISPSWSQKASDHKKIERIPLNNNTKTTNDFETPETKITPLENNYLMDKPEIPTTTSNMPMMFPIPNQESASNMMLPPPPPIWYPPLYPSSYGIDPLHFFIDLRVSGHIYDRKNGKDASPSTQTTPTEHTNETNVQEPKDIFRQSRNASAFSVPIPTLKNLPINLSKCESEKETKILKFDVKSMGFDKDSNKTSTNYIMSNISSIYKQIDVNKSAREEVKIEEIKEETEEEREKRVKDLRALIGLELVVDYMNHAKPGQPQNQMSEESSTDFESADSPAVEVVAIPDEDFK